MKQSESNILIKEHMKNFLSITSELEILCIGTLSSRTPGTISYIIDEKYIKELQGNPNVISVITNKDLVDLLPPSIEVIIEEDPVATFYNLYNTYYKKHVLHKKNKVHPTVEIHPSAVIADNGVILGKNVKIGANAVIFDGVEIDSDSVIMAGAIIGASDVEAKCSKSGVIDILHNGLVKIGKNVIIGTNTTIDKGVYSESTEIGDNTRISNHSLVGHNAKIGKNCFILACTICGSSVVGNNVRVSPGAIISSQVTVGDGAFISVGAVVVSDVSENMKVTGNFAIDHVKFLKNHVSDLG